MIPSPYHLYLSHHSGIAFTSLSFSSFYDLFPLPTTSIFLIPIFLIILELISPPYHLYLCHHSGIDSPSLPPLSFSSFYDWFPIPTTSIFLIPIFLIILRLIPSPYHLYLCHHSGIDSLSLPPLSLSSFWDWFPIPTTSIFLIILWLIPHPYHLYLYHLYLSHPYLSHHSKIDSLSLPPLSLSSFWDWFPLPTTSIFVIILGLIPPPHHLYLCHHSWMYSLSLPPLSFSSFWDCFPFPIFLILGRIPLPLSFSSLHFPYQLYLLHHFGIGLLSLPYLLHHSGIAFPSISFSSFYDSFPLPLSFSSFLEFIPSPYHLYLCHHSWMYSLSLLPLSLSSFWDWFSIFVILGLLPLPYLSHHSTIHSPSLPPLSFSSFYDSFPLPLSFSSFLEFIPSPYHLYLCHHSWMYSLSLLPLSLSSFWDWFSIFVILGFLSLPYLSHHSTIHSLSLPPLSFSLFWDWFPLPTTSIFLIILGLLSLPYLSHHSGIASPLSPYLSHHSGIVLPTTSIFLLILIVLHVHHTFYILHITVQYVHACFWNEKILPYGYNKVPVNMRKLCQL